MTINSSIDETLKVDVSNKKSLLNKSADAAVFLAKPILNGASGIVDIHGMAERNSKYMSETTGLKSDYVAFANMAGYFGALGGALFLAPEVIGEKSSKVFSFQDGLVLGYQFLNGAQAMIRHTFFYK